MENHPLFLAHLDERVVLTDLLATHDISSLNFVNSSFHHLPFNWSKMYIT